MNANNIVASLKKDFGITTLKATKDIKPYFGISFPNLKLVANKISQDNPYEFLDSNNLSIYELEILQAMVIGKLKDYRVAKKYFIKLAASANSWSVVDALCQKFVLTKKNREDMFDQILKFASSKDEFKQRIAAVLLLSHYIDDQYLERAFSVIRNLRNDRYYAKMGVAWATATFYTHFPNQTFNFLTESNLEIWTHNKAIQKIKESFRISEVDKKKVEKLKKKL